MAACSIKRKRNFRNPLPPYTMVTALLTYNPVTGLFRWRIARGGNAHVGDVAGCLMDNGYVSICINGVLYSAHRLAFLLMSDEVPETIDHINGTRHDNRWENLRPATLSQNGGNARLSKRNTSGHKGVSFNKALQKWKASIMQSGKLSHLGYFETPDEAAAAYRDAAEKVFGVYANHLQAA